MALPPVYRSRVNRSATPLAERRITSSGLAQGLTVLGREGSAAVARREEAERQIEESEFRIQEREIARDRMMQGLDAGARFSAVQLELAEKIAELEREPASGGAGHEQAVRQLVSEQRTAFLGTITDDELRARTAEQWADFETRTILRADTFEAGKRVQKSTEDFATLTQNGQALVYAAPTQEAFQEQVASGMGFIEAMEIGADDKLALAREYQSGAFQSLLAGLNDTGKFAEAEALRKDTRFAGLLDYKTSQRFKALAENGAAAEARQAELAEEEARDALRDEIDGVEALIDAGASDVGASRLLDLQTRAQQAGLKPAELVKLADMGIAADVNRRYTGVRQITTAITAAERKLAAGKLDEAGQIELAHLRKRRSTLLEEQGSQYKDDWAKGGNARQGVVGRLYSLPMEDRVEAAQALDKSGTLGRALQLNRGAAAMAVAGAEARGADKALVPVDEEGKAEQRAIFDRVTAGALAEYNLASQGQVLELARNIYAAQMQASGQRDFDEDIFAASVQKALGRDNGRGGVATWQGRGFQLPDWLSGEEFGRKVNGFAFEQAAEPAAVVRRKYAPVLVKDDEDSATWRWRDESGDWLGNRNGGIYTFTLPRRQR